ncbi:MAG: RNA pseudouridine synthase [Treponema sp.]|jgi:23S rRNA pseudouridine1911/1915/1917 synthase|nr:RNA pseudouridine synthase [Treponema sp.]
MTAWGEPVLIDEKDGYAVLYKPPRLHCVPLVAGDGNTLLEWYARRFPAVLSLRGRKGIEGGMVHRLDYETSGLVLAARDQGILDFFLSLQEGGKLVKEYEAVSRRTPGARPGFPPSPGDPFASGGFKPLVIESFFRPYGPGRKTVRPLTEPARGKREYASDRGSRYRTELRGAEALKDGSVRFTLRILRGFRHQIRCHLAWTGWPVLNDPLYGDTPEDETGNGGAALPLALIATGLSFPDPVTGERRSYAIDPASFLISAAR